MYTDCNNNYYDDNCDFLFILSFNCAHCMYAYPLLFENNSFSFSLSGV